MTSNIKNKSLARESPTEPFKRAVTGCLRAIARKPELEVSFAAERPGIFGGKARLPEPPRKLAGPDAAIVRGHADSIALKLACHDPQVHRKLTPGGQQARAVFDAVEQARVEAIGARRMSELPESFGDARRSFPPRQVRRDHRPRRCAAGGSPRAHRPRASDRHEPAVGGEKIVELWRPLIENRAGSGLDRLERLIDNQAVSAMPSTICSMPSTWEKTVRPTPTRRKARRASRTAARRFRRGGAGRRGRGYPNAG